MRASPSQRRCPWSIAITRSILVEPAGLELLRPMDRGPVAAPFEGFPRPAIQVEADLGRYARTLDDQPFAKPERRGLLAEHHLGHRRATDVARTHKTDRETHPAIVASRPVSAVMRSRPGQRPSGEQGAGKTGPNLTRCPDPPARLARKAHVEIVPPDRRPVSSEHPRARA